MGFAELRQFASTSVHSSGSGDWAGERHQMIADKNSEMDRAALQWSISCLTTPFRFALL